MLLQQLGQFRFGKYTPIRLRADGANINVEELVLCIDHGHQDDGKKNFVVEVMSASPGWVPDADVFATYGSQGMWEVPPRLEASCHLSPFISGVGGVQIFVAKLCYDGSAGVWDDFGYCVGGHTKLVG